MQITASTKHGFTFHEHLSNLTLIHMQGRVFDPVIGRFMSADPYVQEPFNSQSLNRYSYAFNNPLSFTDPSGFAGVPGCGVDCYGPGTPAPGPGGCTLFCSPPPPHHNPCFHSWCGPLPPCILKGNCNFPPRTPRVPPPNAVKRWSNTLDARNTASASGAIAAMLRSMAHIETKDLDGNLRFRICDSTGCLSSGNGLDQRDANIIAAAINTAIIFTPIGGELRTANGVGTVARGGAKLTNIAASDALRIQNAANRIGKPIILVGSRARGTATAVSDWDYVINASARVRNSASSSLPGAGNIREGIPKNIDIFNVPIDENLPHVIFSPVEP